VRLPRDLSETTADEVVERLREVKRLGDVVVASIHWGSNWGYDVPAEHVGSARRLVDGGVDIVHGHSSHHPRPIEIYRGRLILYGCGDFIDDYEGISGVRGLSRRPVVRAPLVPVWRGSAKRPTPTAAACACGVFVGFTQLCRCR
jgi:poly-gamma-glutamate capsule biosynthesis protein CapA/YwtB (metallophosphatase superfamily)